MAYPGGGSGEALQSMMRFMSNIGLALSGGGFRATLYHLGVIRYLRDAGALPHVTDIAAVSGGSIVAAHLVLNWDRYTGSDAAFDEAAAEIFRFVQFDLRNHIVRRLPLTFPIRLAGKLIGSDTEGLSPNTFLEGYYREFLYGDRRLFELPERPNLFILTTNVSDGTLAAFNRNGLHVLRRGYHANERDPFQHVPGTTMSIAKAVGASSAFPGFFPPVRVTADDLGVTEGEFPGESFTDGGVYDNLGTRAFSWIHRIRDMDHDQILVSDAGKPFQILGRSTIGFLSQSIRATDILWDRVWQLERENFGDQNGFFFAPITRVIDPAEDPHALHPVVQRAVATLRTDLDRFSDLEIAALVRHGYEVTRATHRHIADRSDVPVYEGPAWTPLANRHALADAGAAEPEPDAPPQPHGISRSRGTSRTAAVATDLRRGSRRRVWSTLFDPFDWPSWIYAMLAVVLFLWLPLRLARMHRHAELLAGVIDSIAKGDPEIRLVLDLVDGDPSAAWNPVPVTAAAESAATTDFSGVDILAFTRIIDLRQARGRSDDPVKLRDRLLLRFGDAAAANRHLVFRSLLPADDVAFRQPPSQPPLSVQRVATAGQAAHLEIHCDLPGVPAGETVPLELTTSVHSDVFARGRMPFDLRYPADLITIWMLFPQSHPYRRYELLRYPEGAPEAAEPMAPRYTIDHPFGTLIGWSVIKPTRGTVYECRWQSD
jgi:predicted acylesterase/phospholipase RssA